MAYNGGNGQSGSSLPQPNRPTLATTLKQTAQRKYMNTTAEQRFRIRRWFLTARNWTYRVCMKWILETGDDPAYHYFYLVAAHEEALRNQARNHQQGNSGSQSGGIPQSSDAYTARVMAMSATRPDASGRTNSISRPSPHSNNLMLQNHGATSRSPNTYAARVMAMPATRLGPSGRTHNATSQPSNRTSVGRYISTSAPSRRPAPRQARPNNPISQNRAPISNFERFCREPFDPWYLPFLIELREAGLLTRDREGYLIIRFKSKRIKLEKRASPVEIAHFFAIHGGLYVRGG